eukprot:TRINITY_DN1914_c0_g1_i1.p1 TRINITY_DN1914_c0_g1~~TRINITY_DN1914_c0_g1_i1.p1  ORF type:complete len:224 (-),score=42.42 TRINITY_DN1914_c0_g1_i1:132-803(-)
MPIFYSLVAKGTQILVEHTDQPGTYLDIVKKLLEKVAPENAKKSYSFQSYTFHYQVEDGITFMCLTDAAFGVRLPFTFLNDIAKRFFTQFASIVSVPQPLAGRLSQFEPFGRTLQDRMAFYSQNGGVDNISVVKTQVEEVKQVMQQNIEKVLDRGQKIEVLVNKTETLNNQSFDFRKNATKLKRKMWWQNKGLCAVLLIVFLLIVAGVVVGALYWKGIIPPIK